MKNAMEGVSKSELETLIGVLTGADVWSRDQAKNCRSLESKGFVRIVKAKNAPKNGAEQQPYFGAKATAKGKRYVAWFA